jgi:hypothetical protein
VQHHASASSIIKIWIMLTIFVPHHLPLSRHTNPLPINAFSLPKHIPIHNPLLQKHAIYTHTAAAKQNNCHTAVPSGLASATRNMTCPGCRLPSDLARLCHRSKLKSQTLSLLVLPNQEPHLGFPFSESVEHSFLTRLVSCCLAHC